MLREVIKVIKNNYIKPILTSLGKVEEITKGGTEGDYDEFGSPGPKGP